MRLRAHEPEALTLRSLTNRVLACVLLAAALPLIGIMSAVIYFADRHNPLFSQVRLGQGEVPFTLYKMRTMRPETPNVTSHQLNESSLTPIGSALRKLKLDELPQLYNVAKGEMMLVGPRPGLPEDKGLTAARREQNVFSIRPGITGLAQVRGIDMSDPLRLAATDREYLDTKSLTVDIGLLLSTVWGNGAGDALGVTE